MLTVLAGGSWFTIPIALSSLSLTVAICAFSVAARNFYLSRYQHVRGVFQAYKYTDAESGNFEFFFDVEIESWGLPVWDMKVKLEMFYNNEFGVDTELYTLELQAIGSLPNPMNAGQVAKFRAMRGELKVGDDRHHYVRTMGVSDLPLERVLIRVYGSAERLIREFNRADFGLTFVSFDPIKEGEAAKQYRRCDSKLKVFVHRLRAHYKREFTKPKMVMSQMNLSRKKRSEGK